MSLKNTIEESVQGNLKIGGRGLDRIKHVVHYTDRDKYTLSIKTGDQVMSLNMAEHELACMGGDILPGVNAGASRTAGGIFAGLRHDLFSRGERSTF